MTWASAASSLPLISILIGIAGKRDVNGKDEFVRASISRIFDQLDDSFPITPKILLTALADGTDKIAFDCARSRENWSTVAVLPLSLDLYAQDFSPAGADWLRARLEDPTLKLKVLPPLIDSRTGKPFVAADLERQPGFSNPARRLHYEQVGLYIAREATVLIGVMPRSERADKIGGTARIAKFRVSGELDDIARNVMEHSQILSAAPPLDIVHSGPLWLIDLDSPPGPDNVLQKALFETCDKSGTWRQLPYRKLQRSLRLAASVERFNRRALKMTRREAPATTQASNATAVLRRIRSKVAAIQRREIGYVRLVTIFLAAVFVAAVSSWELFAEHEEAWPWLFAYVLLVCSAVVAYLTARLKLWQPIAQDYRAVAEAVRVQIAWWEAGLIGPQFLVDDHYLARARGSLSLVRQAVRTLTNSAAFTAAAPTRVPGSENLWIDDQIEFFSQRIAKRQSELVSAEFVSWLLFLASLGSALLLLLQLAPPTGLSGATDLIRNMRRPVAAAVVGSMIAACIASWFLVAWMPLPVTGPPTRRRPLLKSGGLLGALFVGLAAAAGLSSFVGAGKSGIELVSAVVVVFAALAGAIRYRAEKLSWEAELRGYEDALEVFERAKSVLHSVETSNWGRDRKDQTRNQIIFALGKEALTESENWLRAHRERPLEPLVGA